MFNMNNIIKKIKIKNEYGTYMLIISDRYKVNLYKVEKTVKKSVGFGYTKPQTVYQFKNLLELNFTSLRDAELKLGTLCSYIDEGCDPYTLSKDYKKELRSKRKACKSIEDWEQEQTEIEDRYANRPKKVSSLRDLPFYEKLRMFDCMHEAKTINPNVTYKHLKKIILEECNIDLRITNTGLTAFYRDECTRQGIKLNTKKPSRSSPDSRYNLFKKDIYKARKEDNMTFREAQDFIESKYNASISCTSVQRFYKLYCKELGEPVKPNKKISIQTKE